MLTCALLPNFSEKLLLCSIFFRPFPHEHIVKNGRFHLKVSCYKFKLLWNNKNASILNNFGTNVDCTIALVTTCSVYNFLLPWQRGDISKLPKITILSQRLFGVGYTLSYNRPGAISGHYNSFKKTFEAIKIKVIQGQNGNLKLKFNSLQMWLYASAHYLCDVYEERCRFTELPSILVAPDILNVF
jgi:hypothetical protein